MGQVCVIITYKFDSIKIHRKILNKFFWYKKWHSKKFHNISHWIIFLVITGLAFCVVFFGIDSSVNLEELNVLIRVFYIDPEHGDDSADGLFETSAWESFNNVSTYEFKPGDKILIKAGSRLDKRFVVSSSGKLTHPIVISKYGQGNNPQIFGLSIDGKSHIVVEGIDFTGVVGVAVDISKSKNVSLKDCVFGKNRGETLIISNSSKIRIVGNLFTENNVAQEGMGGYVIRATGDSDIQIFQNEITKNTGNAIYLEDTDGAKIIENQITENSFSGIVDVNLRDVAIEKNIVAENGQAGGDYFGIFINFTKEAVIIKNQISTQLGKGAVSLNDSQKVLFATNILYGNQLSGIIAENVDDLKLYNNTVYGLGGSLTRTGLALSEIKSGEVFNNIVYDILGYAVQLQGENDLKMDYNNLGAAVGIASVGDKSYKDIAEYQAQTGYGQHSVSQDPKFKNIFTKDFYLTKESQLINAGTKSLVVVDFDGQAIPQGIAPDIGAFEFIQ